MSDHAVHNSEPSHKHGSAFVHFLESGDGLAHILVAGLLLLLSFGILAASTVAFVQGIIPHFRDNNWADFPTAGLTYLSNLLLGVIVLELLSTILTYIQSRDLEATIKDFLVVALISSIRKILMVGAVSSQDLHAKASDFVMEATGTIISIAGIIALIGGLMLLDKRMKAIKQDKELAASHVEG